ncbi:MAG: 5'-3' exonuclease H3TH domain-containing protein [Dehalococcoidia bacterium]
MAPSDRAPLLIVDGDNLAHRAYHSTPKTVRGADGRAINAVVGFFGMLSNLWLGVQPRAIFVAWDTLAVPTYRHELWPDYQGGREFDPEILEQLELLPGLCAAAGCGVGKAGGYEADDLMAAAVREELADGGSCLLFTSDRDAYQLVSDRVQVLASKRGVSEMDRIGPAEVVERLGVLPEQVPDFKALAGDSSDRIPGARGIGPKKAAALLLQHGDLDGVLEAINRPAEEAQIRRFHDMVLMRPDAEVTLPDGPPRWAGVAVPLRDLGADRIAARLGELDAS